MLLEGASPSAAAHAAEGPALNGAHHQQGYRRRRGAAAESSGSGSGSGRRRARPLLVGATALLGLSAPGAWAFHQPLARPPSAPLVRPLPRLPLRPLHPRPLPTAASPLASPTALPHYRGPHQHHAPEEPSSKRAQLLRGLASRFRAAGLTRRFQSALASPPGESHERWGTSELPPYNVRPDWAPAWVPTWAVTLHPVVQALLMVALYFFHMLVLSKVAVPFPVQLLPNTHGLFQSIGMDSLAGVLFLGALAYFRRARGLPLRPVVFGDRPLPFNPPRKGRGRVWRILAFLMVAYLTSGSASKWVEDAFSLSEVNVALGRAVQVLAGHLVWVALGVMILRTNAGPFFGRASRWMKSSWRTYWLWWAIGGYYVSSLAFHVADTVNQLVLPASAFEVDSVVTQMINPEGNDILAMLVGSLAPCVSAPWWEEVLYRGFLLPALYLFYPPDVATLVSAVIFAAHHMSMSGMIPLTTLGYLWAVLYLLSGNLLVPILIHAMWNSRVFLGSLLGI